MITTLSRISIWSIMTRSWRLMNKFVRLRRRRGIGKRTILIQSIVTSIMKRRSKTSSSSGKSRRGFMERTRSRSCPLQCRMKVWCTIRSIWRLRMNSAFMSGIYVKRTRKPDMKWDTTLSNLRAKRAWQSRIDLAISRLIRSRVSDTARSLSEAIIFWAIGT